MAESTSSIKKLWNRLEQTFSSQWAKAIGATIMFFGLGLAIYARYRGSKMATGDLNNFLFPWYDILLKNGGFAALRDTSFSNYTPPYLYMLALTTYFPSIQKVFAIKSFSLFFDVICAISVFFIARCFQSKINSWIAVITALLLPTVWVNSAWGAV
jgi:Gpi18-like mannosyltransferase